MIIQRKREETKNYFINQIIRDKNEQQIYTFFDFLLVSRENLCVGFANGSQFGI